MPTMKSPTTTQGHIVKDADCSNMIADDGGVVIERTVSAAATTTPNTERVQAAASRN